MSIIELLLISIGLAMDAFAVSICKGLAIRRMNLKKAIVIASFFAFFQACMPFLGYHLGLSFSDKISAIDHWVIFILLGLIGINMIHESLSKDSEDCDDSLRFGDLIMLSVATSIDALAVGISFAFFEVDIISAILIIGIVTFIICLAGVKIGAVFGQKYSAKAELVGGILLIGIGIKVLLEHLFF